jgi:membrane-bound lytic murein transglycosylase B
MPRPVSTPAVNAPAVLQEAAPSPARRSALRAAAGTLLSGMALPGALLAVGGSSRADDSPALRYGRSEKALRLAMRLARQTALPVAWLHEQISRAYFQPQVARLIIPGRPEQKNWRAYRERFLDASRIAAGVRFLRANQPWLQEGEQRFGVPAPVVLGILGVETLYGRSMGDFPVLDSLSTLALDFPAAAPKDRSDYFASQLGDYFIWCNGAGIDPASVRGSYAGAIGMPQFMPGNILRWATRFDGEGSVDLVHSAPDAIASVGHFLSGHGWVAGMPAWFPLQLPATLDPGLLQHLLAPDIVPSFSAAQLRAAGLSLLPQVLDYPGKLAVVQLPNAGQAPDYVLGTDNFFAVTRYNHSAFYALSVLELGHRVELEAAA